MAVYEARYPDGTFTAGPCHPRRPWSGTRVSLHRPSRRRYMDRREMRTSALLPKLRSGLWPASAYPEWEAAYARGIPGQTCASQLETVQRWYDTDQRDQRRVRAVGYGTRPVSLIEQAVGARANGQDWEQRLADALNAFQDCRWPLDHLRPLATAT
jgi:hypothetical protein